MKTIYKINKTQILTYTFLKLFFLGFILLNLSCNDEDDCAYNTVPDCPNFELNIGDTCDSNGDGNNDGIVNDFCECIPIPPSICDPQSELNLSTGIDANGNVITPAIGAIDPYWKIINKPSLIGCSASTASTFTGDAYVINFSSIPGADDWVNQSGSSSLASFDFGLGSVSGCSNPTNSNGDSVPYVFERSFCVQDDTEVDFSFTYKADNEIYFDLVDNSDNSVVSSSATYVYSGAALTWSASGLLLSSGSYSLRGYHVNYGSVLGMSLVGSITTTNGDNELSNNRDECCENNVISILNILDENCNDVFDNNIDMFGVGYDFNLIDNTNTTIRTETTDVNGNVFFAGLPDGTYTVQIVNQAGWTPSGPDFGTITVTVSNNEATILEFFSCIN